MHIQAIFFSFFFLAAYRDTNSNSGTCKDIAPQEQAGHTERCLTNHPTDSPKGETPDQPSQLWPLDSEQRVNDGQATSLAKSPVDDHTKRQEVNNASYAYRPTSIDLNPQHHSSLSTSPSSFHTTSSPLISNRNTHTFQGLEPIEEDEVPYNNAGNFILNPLAPAFVPRQESQMVQSNQLGEGGQPSQGDQQGMLSLSLEHGIGTVSDRFDSNGGPQPV